VVVAGAVSSKSCLVRIWKFHLAKLAAETGQPRPAQSRPAWLEIMLWECPPVASRWDKIECHLFSFILDQRCARLTPR
jgi:hypothetical protein